MNSTAEEKIAVYETQIEDMLLVIQDRLKELNESASFDDYERGRQLAYQEITEIIQTRYNMIWEVLQNEDDS